VGGEKGKEVERREEEMMVYLNRSGKAFEGVWCRVGEVGDGSGNEPGRVGGASPESIWNE
jgi:hypothetical protein